MKKLFLLLVVCIFSFFLLTYRITQVPPGINGDEAAIGYNAALLSKTLHDESGRFLPLFITPKTTDMKQPVYVYAMVALFKIFGPSYFLLRTTSVLFIIVSIIFLYFFCKDYYDLPLFIFSWVILITTPIVLLLSHWGAENAATMPFVVLWLWMMAKFEKKPKNKYLFVGGVSLGLFLFTYYAGRAIAPILVVLTCVYIFLLLKNHIKRVFSSIIYFAFGITPFVVVLYISKFYYPGAILGNYRPDSLPTVYNFIYRYLSTFDLSFLYFKGDATVYHSTGFYGMLLIASLPLFVLGAYKAIRMKQLLPKLILASFFLGPFLFGFVPDIYRASRLLSIVPFYVVIGGLGFKELANIKKVWLKTGLVGAFLILFVVNYYAFANDYWFYYPNRVAQDFSPTESVLLVQMKKGVNSLYKYYSSVQFFSETKDAK